MKGILRKVLCLLLVLIMTASLFGCSQGEKNGTGDTSNENTDNVSDSNQPSDNTTITNDPYAEMYDYLNVDSVPDPDFALAQYEKLLAGELSVAYCILDSAQNLIVEMAETVKRFWDEKGQTCQIFNADGDLIVQAAQIENCATMNFDLIVVASSTIPSLADACLKAMEQGTMVVIRGESSVEACGFSPTALETQRNVAQGWYNADMAFAYFKQYRPEVTSVEFALAEFNVPSNLIEVLNGCKLRIEAETELEAEVAYSEDWVLTLDEGYSFAERALTYDPDIRGFLTYTEAPAIGINNYIMQRPDLDPAEFCAPSNSGSPEATELWDKFSSNESIIPGYVGTDWKNNAEAITNCTWNCLMGIADTTGVYIEYGNLFIECAFDYDFGDGGLMYPES